ncbi:iron complex transport system permease protein [Paenibacillus phyllosphaerae]|uniref:Iron complex transport system permease protein n=1 Tax=Paenibacillus phyllosphaerae TaxID=274593 RepID=A0A7W5FNQ8_9BACL|nr:iron ABC transporter permease [Paenibacillus phyllosphaerae]MBB3111387.1 iron complex transport system permease protein [Paenibacillus phyllosphaerae]
MKLEHRDAGMRELPLYSRPWTAMMILIGGIAALVLSIAISVSFGAADIKLSMVWEAIFRYNPDTTEHQIIRELRLPRVLGRALVGASLAVAGAIMQGMARNPLADSGLLGLNAGAGLMLAICMAFFPAMPYTYMMLAAFAGAGGGAGLVYGISALPRGGLTPLRLVLAGAALTALFTALSEGIALYFHIGQDLAFWYAGGVAGIKWAQLKILFPWIAAATIGAIILSRSITMLSLGEDVARGLGLRSGAVKLAGTVLVLVLAGASVSAAGAVGFVGLLVPHAARRLVGVDYRWIIPSSAVLGALLVVFADLAARMVNPPQETPTAAVLALLGVPFFLYLSRKETNEL